ncbi:MAG: hypothetical protein K5871_01060 [Lachnospiraceae bacterium]|nr:hypothetical protein [Lachnospiraceae bacterium]
MNEQNKKLETLKKRCNVASKVVAVVQIMVIVGTVIAFIGGAYLFASANEVNPQILEGIEKGYLDINTDLQYHGIFELCVSLQDYFPADDYAHPLGITCMVAACTCAMVGVILIFIKKMFTIVLRENNPFSEKCLKQLKVTFIVITITSFLTLSIGFGVITALILFCIHSMFEYGAALQTEIDETL